MRGSGGRRSPERPGPQRTSGASSLRIGDDSDANLRRPRSSRSSSGRLSDIEPGKRMDPMLIGALLAALVIIAMAVGFFLARVTG